MSKINKCPFCDSNFDSRSGLFYHKKRFHSDECSQLYSNFICDIDECSQSFRFLKQYHNHIKSKHPNCDLNLEELNFDSIDEFNKWKDLTQSNTISQYVLHKSGAKVKDGTLTTYFCNRNGSYKNRGNGDKELKTQQSRKSTKSCPASMFVLISETGACNVQFYSKHLGHDLQLEHVDLTKCQKQRIVDELKACNFNKDIVLSKLKATGEETRFNRVDKKELNNIISQYKLSDYNQPSVNEFESPKRKNIKSSEKAENSESSKRSFNINLVRQHSINKRCSKNHNSARKANMMSIETVDAFSWKINSINDGTFSMVNKAMTCAGKCLPFCQRCKICRHSYSCDCREYCRRNTICQHIHYLCMNLEQMGDYINFDGIDCDFYENILPAHTSTIINESPSTNEDEASDNDIANLERILQYSLKRLKERKPNKQVYQKILSHLTEIGKLIETSETKSDLIPQQIDKRSRKTNNNKYTFKKLKLTN